MFKKIFDNIYDYIVSNFKFLVLLLFVYIICVFPVNYYIIIGGGISDIDSRVEVFNEYKSKGSFNISYVTEIRGRLGPYLLSYVIPDWERVSANDYKYDESESFEDIQFRSDLDLDSANDNAIMWAYKLASKDFLVTDTKIFVTTISKEFKNPFKVQDEILNINGKSYDSIASYQEYLQTLSKDDMVSVLVLRNNKEVSLDAKLYSYGDRLILGIGLGTDKDYKTDPKIKIKFKEDESGPSGGLITTLSIYDKLVKKDITKSLKIAGTGTIEEDGSIGEIGGVKYKLLGAIKDEADVFLVPKGENYDTCMEVLENKNSSIKVIGVSTIEEAIKVLEEI